MGFFCHQNWWKFCGNAIFGENWLTKNCDNFDGFLNFLKNIHQNGWQNMRQENLTKNREKVVTKIGDKIFALDFSPELVNFCSLKLVTKTLPFNSHQNRWTFYVLKISPFLVASTYNVASIYNDASTNDVKYLWRCKYLQR